MVEGERVVDGGPSTQLRNILVVQLRYILYYIIEIYYIMCDILYEYSVSNVIHGLRFVAQGTWRWAATGNI